MHYKSTKKSNKRQFLTADGGLRVGVTVKLCDGRLGTQAGKQHQVVTKNSIIRNL